MNKKQNADNKENKRANVDKIGYSFKEAISSTRSNGDHNGDDKKVSYRGHYQTVVQKEEQDDRIVWYLETKGAWVLGQYLNDYEILSLVVYFSTNNIDIS